MWEKQSPVVDVLFSFNGRDQYARPVLLTWNDEDYALGGVQFWYVDRASLTVHLSVLSSSMLDPVTLAFLAVAKVRPELVSITVVDVPTTPLVGYGLPVNPQPRANTLLGGKTGSAVK